VLVVGGSSEGVLAAAQNVTLRRWLMRASQSSSAASRARRIASVCSGAFILADCGILNGRSATTHWAESERLALAYPAVRVDANAIFVKDASVWSSAGITTGIDMALAMVAEDNGREVADRVAAQLVLHARRPGFQSQFSELLAAQARQGDPLSGVVAWAQAQLSELSVEQLAKHAGVSVRTFHRLVKKTRGTSPARLIERLRVEQVRLLLATTDMPLKEIAPSCGFRDATQLSRSFQRAVGVSPGSYRRMKQAN
jgi:transcriptional regulator GlxA family with amidase domain